MSNGRALEEGAIIAENAAAANGDSRGLALLNIPAGGSVPTAAGAPIPAPAPGTLIHPIFETLHFLGDDSYSRLFFCALRHDLLASEIPENSTFSLSFEFIS